MTFKYAYHVAWKGADWFFSSKLIGTDIGPSELALNEFTHHTDADGTITFPLEDCDLVYTNSEKYS
jgi:hypothetical protein